MRASSDNGYPVIWEYNPDGKFPRLRKCRIPGTSIDVILRDGCLGFLLLHYATWYHRKVESLNGAVKDEWGWTVRYISGTEVYTNHASGTAIDLNALKHPLGKRGTLDFKVLNVKRKRIAARMRIRNRLRFKYRGVMRSGEFYKNRVDPMHVEHVSDNDFAKAERLARRLMSTPIGQSVLAANPGLRKAIES